MGTVTLSIRIRRELKEKMDELKDVVDWRREIERFIENKIREVKLRTSLNKVENVLENVPVSDKPAWKDIREIREGT